MLDLSFSQLFLLFLCYSFLGWCCEVVYCSSIEKRFINRGFLHGPICPVYGFGGLLVMFMLEPFSTTWIPLFFFSMIVTSALEYVTSWILEKLFDTKWWDYSRYRFHIKGRVCLLNSSLFGLMGMIACHFVHPFLMKLVLGIKYPWVTYISLGLFSVLMVDFAITVRKLINFNAYLAKLEEFGETVKTHFVNEAWFNNNMSLDELFEHVKEQAKEKSDEATKRMLARFEALNSVRQKKVASFVKHFPTMTSTRYKSQLDHIRGKIKNPMKKQ